MDAKKRYGRMFLAIVIGIAINMLLCIVFPEVKLLGHVKISIFSQAAYTL